MEVRVEDAEIVIDKRVTKNGIIVGFTKFSGRNVKVIVLKN